MPPVSEMKQNFHERNFSNQSLIMYDIKKQKEFPGMSEKEKELLKIAILYDMASDQIKIDVQNILRASESSPEPQEHWQNIAQQCQWPRLTI